MMCKLCLAIKSLKTPADALYTWGLYPNGNSNKNVPLCLNCGNFLWDKISSMVNSGLMHFEISKLS